jgi:hypothetical protein
MPAWLLALLPKAFDLVISIFGGGKKEAGFNDGRELGRAEQQVAAILAELREQAARNQEVGYPDAVVHLQAAEAAVHATAQKYEAALARQGAMLDRCRDERLSWEDVQRHSEAAVHATVREIEAWLRENIVGLGLGDDPYRSGWLDAADEVARRFGVTA